MSENFHSSELKSENKNILAYALIVIIIVNTVVLAYTYQTIYSQYSDLHNQYSSLQEQLQDNLNEIQRLHQKIEILTYLNQSNYSPIPQIFELMKDSVVLIKTKVQTLSGLQDYAQGSGFIYDQEGHIITNNHVIEGADQISVSFTSGNSTKATIVGTDPYSDLAIIKVTLPSEVFHPVILGNSSNLVVGELVVAIGNPFGLSGTITAGIVSQVGRELTAPGNYRIVDVIQLDAAINPGNSGGPLVNIWGEVIGVNTAIITGSIGVGFAIPSDTIQREIHSLLTAGTYPHPWLGINGIDVDADIAESLGLNSTNGILIVDVLSGSPAAAADIRSNDVLVGINDIIVHNFNDLSLYLERYTQPGDPVTVIIIRNHQRLMKTVILGERP